MAFINSTIITDFCCRLSEKYTVALEMFRRSYKPFTELGWTGPFLENFQFDCSSGLLKPYETHNWFWRQTSLIIVYSPGNSKTTVFLTAVSNPNMFGQTGCDQNLPWQKGYFFCSYSAWIACAEWVCHYRRENYFQTCPIACCLAAERQGDRQSFTQCVLLVKEGLCYTFPFPKRDVQDSGHQEKQPTPSSREVLLSTYLVQW